MEIVDPAIPTDNTENTDSTDNTEEEKIAPDAGHHHHRRPLNPEEFRHYEMEAAYFQWLRRINADLVVPGDALSDWLIGQEQITERYFEQ